MPFETRATILPSWYIAFVVGGLVVFAAILPLVVVALVDKKERNLEE